MPVQIGEIHTDVDVRPLTAPPSPPSARNRSGEGNEMERLRSMVLEILRDELDRLRRQQG
jgi:hypothetical protein